jgi:hypothetical protein
MTKGYMEVSKEMEVFRFVQFTSHFRKQHY